MSALLDALNAIPPLTAAQAAIAMGPLLMAQTLTLYALWRCMRPSQLPPARRTSGRQDGAEG